MARNERGYAMLIILIALAIVGWLGRDAIMQMFGGLTRGAGKGAPQIEAAQPPAGDPTSANPAAATPVERARGVEDVVRQQIEKGY